MRWAWRSRRQTVHRPRSDHGCWRRRGSEVARARDREHRRRDREEACRCDPQRRRRSDRGRGRPGDDEPVAAGTPASRTSRTRSPATARRAARGVRASFPRGCWRPSSPAPPSSAGPPISGTGAWSASSAIGKAKRPTNRRADEGAAPAAARAARRRRRGGSRSPPPRGWPPPRRRKLSLVGVVRQHEQCDVPCAQSRTRSATTMTARRGRRSAKTPPISRSRRAAGSSPRARSRGRWPSRSGRGPRTRGPRQSAHRRAARRAGR